MTLSSGKTAIDERKGATVQAFNEALTVEMVEDPDGLARLQPEWDELQASLGDEATFFMSHPWLSCWWSNFGSGASLQLLVVRLKGETVGIFPLMHRRSALHGVPVRSLSFPENGNSLHNEPLVRPEWRDEVLSAVLRQLFRNRSGWDVLQLRNMPASSENCLSLLRLLREEGRAFQARPSFDSPYIELSGSWESYLSGRSARVRKTLRNIENTICREGGYSFEEITGWEGYRQVRPEIEEVARHSWTEKVGDSLANPVNAAFFADLARAAAARGALSLWVLRFGERAVAFEFHLRSGSTEHALRASFHEDHARLSPGAFLEMQILRELFQEPRGIRRLDFGGSFDRYKRRWTESSRQHLSVTAFHDGLGSTVAAFHELKTVAALRSLRDRAILVQERFRRKEG